MNLYEHQAKHILQESGFNLPAGVVCESVEMAEVLAATLNTGRWVVKAQILAGGRARGFFQDSSAASGSGGIRFANSIDELLAHCREMLGATLVTTQTGRDGELVRQVYIEESLTTEQELYLALTIDREQGQLVFIASQQGGSDIELVAGEKPDAISRFAADPDEPFGQARELADALGITASQFPQFEQCLQTMLQQFVEKDMLLMEINPLAVVSGGKLVALDASIVFDDNALFRQGHQEQMEAYSHLSDLEYGAAVQGLNLVKLDGNIATLSSGAGLAMATIDAICQNGGAPANFLDVPPSTAVSHLHKAITLLLRDADTRCLLVNVFGGGIMRCDAAADALLLAYREKPFEVPVVVRLAGTNAELGNQRLSASLPDVVLASDLAAAARICCSYTVATAGKDPAIEAAKTDVVDNKLWRRLRQLVTEKMS